MREKKFRARAKTLDKRWVYGSYIQKDDEAFIYDWENKWEVPVDISTVGQYTGLKDKNGKEIYEGDIIEYDTDFMGKPDNDELRYQVTFSNGSFVLASLDTGYDDYRVVYLHNLGFSVIGNIYENPELVAPTK
jgi:uncharacterized phage protein (TIGR01671 family)